MVVTGQISSSRALSKKRSMSTLAMELQSKISRSLDEDNYILTSSLDLRSAFDIVYTELLFKKT
jgi:hypothetical protein